MASTAANGTLIPSGAHGFIQDTKVGRALATGNSAMTEDFAKIMKLAKPLSRGILLANLAGTGVQVTDDFLHGRSKSGNARIAVLAVGVGATFIPVFGWGISLGIGVADAVWGDQFYNYVEKNW